LSGLSCSVVVTRISRPNTTTGSFWKSTMRAAEYRETFRLQLKAAWFIQRCKEGRCAADHCPWLSIVFCRCLFQLYPSATRISALHEMCLYTDCLQTGLNRSTGSDLHITG
jgi:hypothetical protein